MNRLGLKHFVDVKGSMTNAKNAFNFLSKIYFKNSIRRDNFLLKGNNMLFFQ